ncbi:MAG TPA: hypothetical protein VEW95_04920 [Candidatus Limnocylindrales bacterium]|nr:hypothetical protein [Candidatus Limnocylindrales bacterium]
MTRTPELHERFADWLTARPAGSDEDPPRDLALHAAGCDRCLRSAAAVDTLQAVDVGAAALPPLRIEALRDERRGLPRLARFAVAGAALVLVAGSVAIGSSWLGGIRPIESAEQRTTPGEGILAGAPSATETPRPTPTATTTPSPSRRPSASASASASEEPTDDPVAPTFANPQPTYQPPSTPPPTAVPTGAPSPTPAPTRTASPTSTPAPTPVPTPPPTPAPTPTASPTPDDCADGIDNDGDTFIDGLDPGCILSGNEIDA